MESRPAPLRSRRVCRFCLTESEPLNFIYERDHHSRPFNVPLTLQIMSCVAIEVYSADGMPQMICNNCRWNLDRSYKFKQQCKKADEALRAYPMTGTLPRPFPPINAGDNKAEFIGSSGKRSGGVEREQPVKKSRVDNGDQQQQQQQQQQPAPPAPVIVSRPRGRPPRHAATPTAPAVAPATPKVERSDSNYRVSRSISEGEKKRPDNDDGQSRRRRNKGKIDTESDDEDDEEEPYSDGDDDYEPPAYVAKKLPKTPKREVLSKYDDDSSAAVETDEKIGEKKIIFVRNKEGKIVKKAIKTMLPIQQQQQQQQSSSQSPPSPSSHEAAETRPSTRTSAGIQRSNLKVVHNQNKTINDESSTNDVTEAEVQKIVASVFKEHKIPLKQAKISQEQVKETTVSTPKAQTIQTIKKEKIEASPETSSVVPAAPSTQKSVNTVKVIKRVVVRKPTGGAETTTTTTTTTKDGEPIKTTTTTSSSSSSAAATATTGTKVKRTIIRRIIRQGDTTREVLLNADGTPIDPAELAKLPIGNVVKRVVLKKSNNQTSQVQQSSSTTTTTTSTEKQQKPQQLVQKKITTAPIDTPKFELKTSQNKTSTNEKKPITTTNVAVKKPVVVSNLQSPSSSSSSTTTTTTTAPVTKNNNATSERVLQLEKQLETQRLVIQKLQAKKQQEYETNDDMLPDRHDSEDEQELPLKRVFVKRKQSIYDEERAYNDNDREYEPREQVQPLTAIAIAAAAAAEDDATDNGDGATDATADATADANTTTATDDKTDKQDASSVECNKTDVFIKMEASSGVDDISRELNSILESTDNVVKMQENVLNNLTEISGINDNENDKDEQEQVVKMQIDDDNNIDDDKTNQIEKQPDVENKEIDNATVEQGVVDEQQQQNLNTTQDLFDNSDGSICQQKNEESMNDSVIALSQTNDTINLNDTTDTQDSLEDTLSQMEG